MKRIVYNNRLKKLIIATLIIMLLFNFIFPNMVMATVNSLEVQANSLTGSIQIVADSIRTTSRNPNDTVYYIRDLLGLSKDNVKVQIGNMKNVVIQKIKEKFPDLEESLAEKACNYYRNNQDMIEVKFSLGGNNSYLGGSSISYTINFGEEFTQSKIETDLEGKTDEQIGRIQDEAQSETGSSEYGAGSNPTGGPTNNIDSENNADIGGILLSPVFYLINFIADAIIGTVENMMTGEGLATGIDVLTSDVTDPQDGKTYYEYIIDMSQYNTLGTVQYPNIKYTPEEIFAGQIDLLSIDFISGQTPERDENGNIKYEDNGNVKYSDNSDSGWISVRKVISSWYKVLRMIAIIGLLSVLIYTGIKIIISANAKDKAKYKEWIINWFIAVAILFSMHYIMSFIISVTREISNLLNNTCQGIKIVNGQYESVTNLMGLVRFMIQAESFYMKIGYEVMYIALIVYTVKFTMVYLKRVLNMAFLTLIAPIVALTYPIDKINDGKAQGFDMWIKEYIYNALLQPMHYVMYYILVGSAVSIAAKNPLYGIVVLMFMTEAEKLLKKIFGFDKAGGGTVGGMAGAFAAGAIASNIKNIARMSKLPGGNGGNGGSDGKVEEYLKDPKPNNIDNAKDDELYDRPEDSNNSSLTNGQEENAEEQKDNKLVDSNASYLKELEEERENSSEWTGRDEEAYQQLKNEYGPKEEQPKEEQPEEESSKEETIQQKINNAKKGWKNVGKALMKPAWDFEKPPRYNGKRLAKAALRGGVGTALGIGAAAVQAGISITDGKYNPMEGMATFAAGYAGGGQISKGVGSLIDTYREGRDEGNKNAIMKRAQEKWGERDDVIAYNKKKYAYEDRKYVLEIQKQLLSQGITDPSEMHSCIKYIKSINGNKVSGYTSDMIRQSRIMHDFSAEMTKQGVNIYDSKKREEYVKTVGKTERERRILRNKLEDAVKYREAQR